MINEGLIADKDAGWGLIFRLNGLWPIADYHAREGKYDAWDSTLDCIYRNLLYRNKIVVNNGKDEEIESVELTEEDRGIYKFLSKKVYSCKKNYLKKKNLEPEKTKSKLPHTLSFYRSQWYNSLHLKDIWLRKFMMELGLYLRETKQSPGTSLFGTLKSKR